MAKGNALSKKNAAAQPEQADAPRKLAGIAGTAEPQNLDRLIHERTRLGIVSALAANHTLSFTELKQLMNMTDGNLSIHTRKLEEANYITCTKSFIDRRPNSQYQLTAAGRRALERYLGHMEALIRATRNSLES